MIAKERFSRMFGDNSSLMKSLKSSQEQIIEENEDEDEDEAEEQFECFAPVK